MKSNSMYSKSKITCCMDCKDRYRNVYDDGTIEDCHVGCKVYNQQLEELEKKKEQEVNELRSKRVYGTSTTHKGFYSKLGTYEKRLSK